MDYNLNSLIPYIPAAEYDAVAEDFLGRYYPEALERSIPVPIEEVARNKVGPQVQILSSRPIPTKKHAGSIEIPTCILLSCISLDFSRFL
jgi:hypothetical protein